MTNVLILGGTGWLSGTIAGRLVADGADVTCLARGERPAPPGAALVRADRSDPQAYAAVSSRRWDHVIDVSSRADHVAGAVEALGRSAERWSFVSTVSVYADDRTVGADESAELVDPSSSPDDDYGRQKVAAEQAVRTLGERSMIVRPGLIVGAGDPSGRFGYWAAAFARNPESPVLVPAAAGRMCQVIDVEDLAAFLVTSTASGVVDAVGLAHPLSEVLTHFRRATGHRGGVVHAEDDWLVEQGVNHWMGERSLPLWLPVEAAGFLTRSGERYRQLGGGLRPIAETVAVVVEDERRRGLDRARRAGLTMAEERELLRLRGIAVAR